LIFTLLVMVFGSSAHSQAVTRFISNQQWEASVQITFNLEVRDREPTMQIISLEGVTGGEIAVRLLSRRPWIESRVPQMEITLRAAEISLIFDLSNPSRLLT
jgi:hypothetical protein